MSKCFVCGRALKNPCTASRGCGPVCCGTCGSSASRKSYGAQNDGRRTKKSRFRSFYERVSMRWARPWGLDWVRWIDDERPCIVCRNVVLLKLELQDNGVVVFGRKLTGHEERFVKLIGSAKELTMPGYWDGDSVPAWCRKRKVFIDANRSSRKVDYYLAPGIEWRGCQDWQARTSSRPAQISFAEVEVASVG